MPKKAAPIAGPSSAVPWTADEIAVIRRIYSSTTSQEVANRLNRSVRSIDYKARHLGLLKSREHRSHKSSEVARRTLDLNHLKEAGRKGGLAGGVARSAVLCPERRKEISSVAGTARWEKKRAEVKIAQRKTFKASSPEAPGRTSRGPDNPTPSRLRKGRASTKEHDGRK